MKNVSGTAAALIFPKVFFANVDPATGTLLALLSFGIGYIARPVGAVILGHFGDRIGRKTVLLFTLVNPPYTMFRLWNFGPTVAQWTDAETLEFVRTLWDQAQRRRWPLLIAVTHWEREWRELAQARRKGDADPSLVDFEGQRSVDTLHLANAVNDALRDYLAQRLPGLTREARGGAAIIGAASFFAALRSQESSVP